MELTILSKHLLEGVPSASGIEMVDNAFYVICDNSPWIFKLNNQYEIVDKFQIVPVNELVDGIIPKTAKPDFEAITSIKWGPDTMLLVFGSGSKSPERDVMVSARCAAKAEIKTYSLERFYENLKEAAKLRSEELNIEAAVFRDNELYLLNRGINLVMNYPMEDFKEYLEGKRISPKPGIYRFNLPKVNGIEAGFSGAAIIPNEDKIVFTASVENTSNWIDDGQVLGSFVGIIDLKELGEDSKPACVQIMNEGKPLHIKVESLTVPRGSVDNEIHLLLVTDSDGGNSELIEAILRQ